LQYQYFGIWKYTGLWDRKSSLGSAATFVALAGSTLTNTGANLIGRLLSLNGALMMDTNSTPFPITNTQLFNFSYLPLNMKWYPLPEWEAGVLYTAQSTAVSKSKPEQFIRKDTRRKKWISNGERFAVIWPGLSLW
jgi:hypothetical protein